MGIFYTDELKKYHEIMGDAIGLKEQKQIINENFNNVVAEVTAASLIANQLGGDFTKELRTFYNGINKDISFNINELETKVDIALKKLDDLFKILPELKEGEDSFHSALQERNVCEVRINNAVSIEEKQKLNNEYKKLNNIINNVEAVLKRLSFNAHNIINAIRDIMNSISDASMGAKALLYSTQGYDFDHISKMSIEDKIKLIDEIIARYTEEYNKLNVIVMQLVDFTDFSNYDLYSNLIFSFINCVPTNDNNSNLSIGIISSKNGIEQNGYLEEYFKRGEVIRKLLKKIYTNDKYSSEEILKDFEEYYKREVGMSNTENSNSKLKKMGFTDMEVQTFINICAQTQNYFNETIQYKLSEAGLDIKSLLDETDHTYKDFKNYSDLFNKNYTKMQECGLSVRGLKNMRRVIKYSDCIDEINKGKYKTDWDWNLIAQNIGLEIYAENDFLDATFNDVIKKIDYCTPGEKQLLQYLIENKSEKEVIEYFLDIKEDLNRRQGIADAQKKFDQLLAGSNEGFDLILDELNVATTGFSDGFQKWGRETIAFLAPEREISVNEYKVMQLRYLLEQYAKDKERHGELLLGGYNVGYFIGEEAVPVVATIVLPKSLALVKTGIYSVKGIGANNLKDARLIDDLGNYVYSDDSFMLKNTVRGAVGYGISAIQRQTFIGDWIKFGNGEIINNALMEKAMPTLRKIAVNTSFNIGKQFADDLLVGNNIDFGKAIDRSLSFAPYVNVHNDKLLPILKAGVRLVENQTIKPFFTSTTNAEELEEPDLQYLKAFNDSY